LQQLKEPEHDLPHLARMDHTGQRRRLRIVASGRDFYRHQSTAHPGIPKHSSAAPAIENEVEFVTIMEFDSLDAVRAFAGADYEVAVVPPKARAILSRFDARSQHYEVRIDAD
jgi:hypothetical protein